MNRFLLGLGSFIVGGVLAYWLVVSGMDVKPKNQHPSKMLSSAIGKPSTTPSITPQMLKDSEALMLTVAPDFAAADENGTVHKLAELANNKPLLLVFIEKECPSAVIEGAYLERIHKAYADVVSIYGVINAEPAIAKKWSKDHRTSFPILTDPRFSMIKSYQVKCSTYMILISASKKIERAYPGYSQGLIKDLGERIARLAKVKPRTFPIDDMTKEPTTGVAFNIEGDVKR